MKIDLHVHTVKVKNKDTYDRNIKSISDFCEQMEKSNVGIVAITNHNYFDFDQYYEISKEINNKKQILMVIPGVEVDVKVGGNRRQLNVLFSPNDVDQGFKNFYNHFKEEFEKINNSSSDAIEWEDFKNFFLNENISNSKVILYIDNKKISNSSRSSKNSTSFSKEEVDLYLSVLNKLNNLCLVRDVNEELDFNYFMYWNADSLIGSDNLDWENYIDKSVKLLEYNLAINTFDDLFLVFKNKATYDVFNKFKLLKNLANLKVEKEKNKYYTLNNLKIVQGATNIIFGPKACGKTSLLEAIYKRIESTNKCSYKPSDKLICIDDYKKEKYLENKKNLYNKLFNKILNFENYKRNDKPSDFYNFFNSKGKQTLFQFINNFKEDTRTPIYEDLANLIKENIVKLKDYINNVIGIKNLIDKIKDKIENNISYSEEEIKKIISDNTNTWINFKRKIFINNINTSLVKKLEAILRIYKNTINKPSDIGLHKLFSNRSSLYYSLVSLDKIFHEDNNFYNIETFHIPNSDGTEKIIHLKYKLVFLYNHAPHSAYSKSLNKLFRNYIKNKIFIDPTEEIQKLNKVYKDNFIESNVENENFVFFKDNKEIKISNGERHFLNLNYLLSKNYDYYFLDEPETSLNNNFISKIVQQKLSNLNRNKKTIVMTTHNNILGMNSNAMNFIFRDNKKNNDDIFDTLIGNIQEVYLQDIINNEKTNIDIRKKLFDVFEGDESKYKYRRKIYGVD